MNAPLKGPSKRATNISLTAARLDEARSLGINISQACERGLAQSIADVRAAQWRMENGAAIQSSNAYVEENGLPLAGSRLF